MSEAGEQRCCQRCGWLWAGGNRGAHDCMGRFEAQHDALKAELERTKERLEDHLRLNAELSEMAQASKDIQLGLIRDLERTKAERDQAIQGERDRACERDALRVELDSVRNTSGLVRASLENSLREAWDERDRAAKWDYEPAWKSAEVRVAALSAQLEEARAALRSIAGNSCCSPCREAALVAAQALSIPTPVKPRCNCDADGSVAQDRADGFGVLHGAGCPVASHPLEDLKEKQP